MRPKASHAIKSLTSNVTISTQERELWNKCMSDTANLKIKITKKHRTVLFLKKLRQKNLGTNETENYVKTMKQNIRKKVRRSILKHKINDAISEEIKIRSKYNSSYGYLWRRWGHNTVIFSQFRDIMQRETEWSWEKEKEKMTRKIAFLAKKQKYIPPDFVDDYRGILISDQLLTEKYETPTPVPINHGEIPLSDSEKEILCLPPGFTVYNKIDKVKIETAAEVMIDKLRWEMWSKEERDGEDWDEEEEWETVKEKTVYDEARGVLDFAKQRVTDMPTCRRITVPEPRGETEEIVFANIKSRFSAATAQAWTKITNREKRMSLSHSAL